MTVPWQEKVYFPKKLIFTWHPLRTAPKGTSINPVLIFCRFSDSPPPPQTIYQTSITIYTTSKSLSHSWISESLWNRKSSVFKSNSPVTYFVQNLMTSTFSLHYCPILSSFRWTNSISSRGEDCINASPLTTCKLTQ